MKDEDLSGSTLEFPEGSDAQPSVLWCVLGMGCYTPCYVLCSDTTCDASTATSDGGCVRAGIEHTI